MNKTFSGELKDAQEHNARLQGFLDAAETKVESVGGFAQCVTLWLTMMALANVGLVFVILFKKAGG